MAKKSQTTPAAMTPRDPIKFAEGMVYGAGLQVQFNQEAYDKGIKSLVEDIHRLAENVEKITADNSRSPHQKIEYINHTVIQTLSNLHLTEMFRRGHELETAQDDLKHEQEILDLLKAKKEAADVKISPSDVAKFHEGINKFVDQIIEEKCKDCAEFQYGNNYECFCTEVLEMLDERKAQQGYDKNCSGDDEFICNCWNRKQKAQSLKNYKQV